MYTDIYINFKKGVKWENMKVKIKILMAISMISLLFIGVAIYTILHNHSIYTTLISLFLSLKVNFLIYHLYK